MSKRELQKIIKETGGVEFLNGTLNLADLLAQAYDLITMYDLRGNPFKYIQNKSFRSEIKDLFRTTDGENGPVCYPMWNERFYGNIELIPDKESEAYMIWDEVCNYFNNLAPNGYYFGSTEGDGSDIGWWKIEENGEEF